MNLTTYQKVLISLGLISVITVGGTTIGLNYSYQKKAEANFNQFNGYMAPEKTYFDGLSIHFDKANCTGLFSYECSLDNVSIKGPVTNSIERQEFFAAKNIVFHNVSKDGFFKPGEFIDLSLTVNNFEPKGIIESTIKSQTLTKEKETLNTKIYKNLFPLTANGSIQFKRYKEKSAGNIFLEVDNRILKASYNGNFSLVELNELFKFYIDENGNIIKEINPNQLVAERNTGQKYKTYLDSFVFKVEDKALLDSFYDLYKLNMLANENKKEINMNLFDLNSSRELTKEEFKKHVLINLSKMKKDSPFPYLKDLVIFAENTISNKNKNLEVQAKRKIDLTLEEFQASKDAKAEDISLYALINNTYNFKINSK